ncbi:hypothetical protein AGMMS49992_19950 [Clostridia bacterium]|nr:hypothetical protein AGMMS49992_19950 [Clostridia bacterium]
MMYGKRNWFFPDAELPPMGMDPEVYGHESIIILNPNAVDAHVNITLYWEDQPPTEGIIMDIGAGRVRCERATARDGFLGVKIPEGKQYAFGLCSDLPVIAQYGRLDVRQSNMAFYTTPGYTE